MAVVHRGRHVHNILGAELLGGRVVSWFAALACLRGNPWVTASNICIPLSWFRWLTHRLSESRPIATVQLFDLRHRHVLHKYSFLVLSHLLNLVVEVFNHLVVSTHQVMRAHILNAVDLSRRRLCDLRNAAAPAWVVLLVPDWLD